ncbi:MAG: CHAT domain-containing protein, partial [Prochlorotrichaceae cyanobacterium]
SLELAQSLNLGAESIKTLLSLGHLSWDRPLQSFNYFTQALQTATDFPDLQLQAQVNLIRLGLRFPRSASQLTDFYTGLQDNLQRVPLSRARVFARLNLAETLLQYPNRDEIFALNDSDFQTLLNQALEDSEALADGRLQAYALGVWGTFEERQENWIQAQAYTEQALLRTQQLNDPVGLYQWQWQLGRVLVAEAQWSRARSTYAQTLETLEGLRTDLANLSTDLTFSFEEKIDPVYRQYVQLLLTPEPGVPLSQERLQTARTTIESLQVEELVSFFKANCVSAQPIDIETLDASAAIIYPILLRDSLEIIVGFPGQPLQHYQSSVTRGTLERAAQLLRLALAESSSPQRWRRSAAGDAEGNSSQAVRLTRYIYDALIKPMAADLKSSGAKTLVFTLDGALRNIPMGVLSDGERYLLED